ncbi:MAG: hypothetical protein ACFCVH_13725 [Alphaproteobacteria bacterium]
MAVVARALSDTLVNAAPPSLLRGGVYVPFSTPLLMIARLRLDEDGRPTALVPALSGGQGYYVVPWPMLPDLVNMTIYDRALHESLAGILHADPNFVRKKALDVRRLGLCGPRAAAAAAADHAGDSRRRENIFCFLVQRIAMQAGRPIEGLQASNMRSRENLSALRGLATGIDVSPDALIERLDTWSSQIALLGLDQKDLRGPVRQQLGDLRAMFDVMGEWASNDHPEYVGSAKRCLTAGEAIMDLIQSQITRIDNECEDALGIVVNWTANAGLLKSISNFAVTAVQIWHAATVEWRAVAEDRDRHAMRARIGFIETLLPVLAPSDMLKFQRNRATQELMKGGSKPIRRRFKGRRSSAQEPEAGLREAVIEATNSSEALQHMLCWPFRTLVRSRREPVLPGDLPHGAVASLVHHLRKTWSTRDVARFDAVLATIDEPATFQREVDQLRKTIHLMLAEWLAWHSDPRPGRPADEVRLAQDIPDLTDDEAYAATMMLSVGQVVELLSQLPRPPITWITIDNMRHIGATLEGLARAGFARAGAGCLHLIMRGLAEPCDIIQTLRHLAAHHGPQVTDHPWMRSVVDSLIARLETIRDEIGDAAIRFDGSPQLAQSIERFVAAIGTGVMTLPIRQDGGVSARVRQVIAEVAEIIRAEVLGQLESRILEAFPSCDDPFSSDEEGKIANVVVPPDQEALACIEQTLDLLQSLRDLHRMFDLANALNASKLHAGAAAERVASRLQQAMLRMGTAHSEHLSAHVMSTIWLVERLVGADAADRLRKRTAQMCAGHRG